LNVVLEMDVRKVNIQSSDVMLYAERVATDAEAAAAVA
jgi:hypothetical protein